MLSNDSGALVKEPATYQLFAPDPERIGNEIVKCVFQGIRGVKVEGSRAILYGDDQSDVIAVVSIRAGERLQRVGRSGAEQVIPQQKRVQQR